MTTRHPPEEFIGVADKHRDAESEIGRAQTTAANTVDNLLAANSGQLMRELDRIQNEWMDRVNGMRRRLTDMADFMVEASKHLNDADQENPTWLPPVPA